MHASSRLLSSLLALVPAATPAWAQTEAAGALPPGGCELHTPARWLERLREGVARGEVADPARRPPPAVAPLSRSGPSGGCFHAGHLFPYEDTRRVLLSDFSEAQLYALMAEASNALLAAHGDEFDFVGFWLNFTPHHELGAAFYLPIANDVGGIGDASTVGVPVFDFRAKLGLAGRNVDGWVMMWDVRHFYWAPGTGPTAAATRLVLGHEFAHRFATYLPDLSDGTELQGDDGGCGRAFHWNHRVDGQGSALEISEWTQTGPALPTAIGATFNGDTGGVFSGPELYLMGYVTPGEMDAGMSEFRYMVGSDCSSSHAGAIRPLSAADIVARAGARVPDAANAQKHFRTGWIMLHLPGSPPTTAELDKAVGILEQHMVDWNLGTLGRGTMDVTLFDECNTAEPYGTGANPPGSLTVLSGRPSVGQRITFGVDNPLGTQGPGALPLVFLSLDADPAYPAGSPIARAGMAGPGAVGELLVGTDPGRTIGARQGGPWAGTGVPAAVPLDVPADLSLLGTVFYAQGLLIDPAVTFGVRFGLTNGIELQVGP